MVSVYVNNLYTIKTCPTQLLKLQLCIYKYISISICEINFPYLHSKVNHWFGMDSFVYQQDQQTLKNQEYATRIIMTIIVIIRTLMWKIVGA